MRLSNLLIIAAIACPLVAQGQQVPLDEVAFTEHMATLLKKEVGDAAVAVKGPLTLSFGEIQANLDRVFAFCRRERGACESELDRYVKGAAQAHKDLTAPLQRDEVRLVVRTSQYVQAIQDSAPAQGAQIQPQPFAEGLLALPVLDGPRTLRFLGSKGSKELGLSVEDAHELGLSNLRSMLKPLMEVAKAARPGQIGRVAGDSYDPSRLLLHDTWAPLAKAQGGVLIVAIPVTDAVFYMGEDTSTAIDALRSLVKDVQARSPNPLSDMLLQWTEAGWVPVR